MARQNLTLRMDAYTSMDIKVDVGPNIRHLSSCMAPRAVQRAASADLSAMTVSDGPWASIEGVGRPLSDKYFSTALMLRLIVSASSDNR